MTCGFDLLMVPRNRFLPGLRPDLLPVLQEFARVFVVKILDVASQSEMASPDKSLLLQYQGDLGLCLYRARFGMVIIR